MSRNRNLEIEFDEETGDYYIIWEPVVLGLGKTGAEALRDLREAAHAGIDTLINLKLADMRKSKVTEACRNKVIAEKEV